MLVSYYCLYVEREAELTRVCGVWRNSSSSYAIELYGFLVETGGGVEPFSMSMHSLLDARGRDDDSLIPS